MTEMNHTPQPWTYHEKGIHPHPYVCGPVVDTEYGEDRYLIAYLVGRNQEENGRLITAAPDMLAALIQIATANPEDVAQWELRDIAETAIAKATRVWLK